MPNWICRAHLEPGMLYKTSPDSYYTYKVLRTKPGSRGCMLETWQSVVPQEGMTHETDFTRTNRVWVIGWARDA